MTWLLETPACFEGYCWIRAWERLRCSLMIWLLDAKWWPPLTLQCLSISSLLGRSDPTPGFHRWRNSQLTADGVIGFLASIRLSIRSVFLISTSDWRGPSPQERLGRSYPHQMLTFAKPIQSSTRNLSRWLESQAFISLSVHSPMAGPTGDKKRDGALPDLGERIHQLDWSTE